MTSGEAKLATVMGEPSPHPRHCEERSDAAIQQLLRPASHPGNQLVLIRQQTADAAACGDPAQQ